MPCAAIITTRSQSSTRRLITLPASRRTRKRFSAWGRVEPRQGRTKWEVSCRKLDGYCYTWCRGHRRTPRRTSSSSRANSVTPRYSHPPLNHLRAGYRGGMPGSGVTRRLWSQISMSKPLANCIAFSTASCRRRTPQLRGPPKSDHRVRWCRCDMISA
jgi:hypothetical protein